jgi:hypothetical protein
MTYDEKGHKQQAQNGNSNWTLTLILIFFCVGLNDGGPDALILADSRDSTLHVD